MMANISIVPDLNAPGGGLGMAGMRHQHAPPTPAAATKPAPAAPAPAKQ
jgi:hypothetical protein